VERMPSDLNDLRSGDLMTTGTDIQVSQMSITEVDVNSVFNDLLDVQWPQGEGITLLTSVCIGICVQC